MAFIYFILFRVRVIVTKSSKKLPEKAATGSEICVE